MRYISFLFFCALAFAIGLWQTGAIQQKLKISIQNELSLKLNQDIQIESLSFKLPNTIVLENLHLKDIHIDKLELQTSLAKLLFDSFSSGNLTVQNIKITNSDNNILLPSLSLNISQDKTSKQWDFELHGIGPKQIEFQTSGIFNKTNSDIILEISTLILKNNEHQLEILNPIHFQKTSNDIQINPVQISLDSGAFVIDAEYVNPYTAKFHWNSEITPLLKDIISPSLFLTGQIDVSLLVSNLNSSPTLNGIINLSQGSFESLDSGAIFNDISARFSLEGEKLILTDFQAQDHQKGSITGKGVMEMNSAELFPFKVDLELRNAQIVNLDRAQAFVSGQAVFAGTLENGSLSGELDTNLIDISLPEQSQSSLKSLEVTYINQTPDSKSAQQIRRSSKWPLHLNLLLHTKGETSIHNNDFASKWKGDIHLTGTSKAPLLTGELRIASGEYEFNGSKWNLHEGTLAFAGDPIKNTSIFIVAQREIGDITADIIVKGPLEELVLDFRSTPPLSQKEILSWILFGRGSNEISSFQGAELTKSIHQLKREVNSGDNLFSRIKKSVGIDRIDVSHKDDQVSVQVGKYVTPKVFVGVTKGITDEANRVGVEVNVMKNVKVQAEIGDDAEGQLHLKWKHDY